MDEPRRVAPVDVGAQPLVHVGHLRRRQCFELGRGYQRIHPALSQPPHSPCCLEFLPDRLEPRRRQAGAQVDPALDSARPRRDTPAEHVARLDRQRAANLGPAPQTGPVPQPVELGPRHNNPRPIPAREVGREPGHELFPNLLRLPPCPLVERCCCVLAEVPDRVGTREELPKLQLRPERPLSDRRRQCRRQRMRRGDIVPEQHTAHRPRRRRPVGRFRRQQLCDHLCNFRGQAAALGPGQRPRGLLRGQPTSCLRRHRRPTRIRRPARRLQRHRRPKRFSGPACRLPGHSRPPCEGPVEHHTDGKEIGARIGLAANELLGRKVARRPDQAGVANQRTLGIEVGRHTKVEQDGPSLRVHQHIAGLEVAMDDPLAMHTLEHLEERPRRLGNLLPCRRPLESGEGSRLLKLRHEVGSAVANAVVNQRHNARELQQPKHRDLLPHPRELGIAARLEELHGNLPFAHQIAPSVDGAEASRTDVLLHHVATGEDAPDGDRLPPAGGQAKDAGRLCRDGGGGPVGDRR